VGLVAYRDRGDAYITKVIDLTDDLDEVHKQLMGFKAEGGGDEPESVNQALDDAVHKVKWSTGKKTLRIIFLVGDAAPHMDYKDGGGGAAAGDLADEVKEKRVRLEDVKEHELPEELKKLKTAQERKEYVEKLDRRPAEINRKILDLTGSAGSTSRRSWPARAR